MSEPITVSALERNTQQLFVSREKRKRGRPPKSVLGSNDDDIEYKPSKPTANTASFFAAYPEIPRDNFGKWKKTHVSETSEIFVDWLEGCQNLVDGHFGPYIWDVKTKNYKKYIWIVIENEDGTIRVFAFVDRNTANIHCPATFDSPFEHFVGNITDPETQYSVIGPYGVITPWVFLPTHENVQPIK